MRLGSSIYLCFHCTESCVDSVAWKVSELYQDRSTALERGHTLADKTCEIDLHVINPYKEPIASSATYSEFTMLQLNPLLWRGSCCDLRNSWVSSVPRQQKPGPAMPRHLRPPRSCCRAFFSTHRPRIAVPTFNLGPRVAATVTRQCPPPTHPSCACDPADLDIDRGTALRGTMPRYAPHVVIGTGATDWPSRIKFAPDGIASRLKPALKKHGDPFTPVLVTNSSLPEAPGDGGQARPACASFRKAGGSRSTTKASN